MSKAFYTSKTFWAIALAFLIAVAQIFSVTPGELSPELLNIVQMISLAFGLYGRFTATQPLSLK